MSEQNENQSQKLIGVLAQFDDADALLEGGSAIHESGYQKLDAYSPFPVHGIDDAIGIKRTVLPFFVLFIGIGAAGGGVFLQWYTNAWVNSPVFPGYDVFISGKPMWSLPANIPVAFEIIVLSAAFAAFFGMLVLNKLPQFANPLHRIARFRRASNDRFFISVDAEDEKFDLDTTTEDLRHAGATDVEPIYMDQSDHQMPSFVRTFGILTLLLLFIPPVMIYRARGMTNRKPRLHVNPDMDFQTKFKAQTVGPNLMAGVNRATPEYLWNDIRAAREPVQGTIARNHLEDDIEFYRGIKAGSEAGHAEDEHAANLEQRMLVSLTRQQDPATQDPADPATQDPATQDPETQDPAAEETVPEPDWISEFPARLTIADKTLLRGKKMFEINCVACHGYSGNGDGLVQKRAKELAALGKALWTDAKTLHDPEVIKQPVGRIFDTITHGRNTMGPYGQRLKPEDRWAIVLYIQAIQKTKIDSDEKYIPPPPPPEEESPEGGADGAAVDGAAVDGAAVDGAAVDGAAVDGAAVDGAAVDGAAVDGAAPNSGAENSTDEESGQTESKDNDNDNDNDKKQDDSDDKSDSDQDN